MASSEHHHGVTKDSKGLGTQANINKPSLPPNVSIFSPNDPKACRTVLQGHIFSRLTTSSQTQPSQLLAAFTSSSGVSEAFCLSHGSAVLVFDAEQSGIDLKDNHHDHVRTVCLALKDADITLSISGCVFDATDVVKAGFQLDRLSSGSVMVVDLMHDNDDDDDGSDEEEDGGDDEEDAKAILLGGESGVVLS